METTMVVEGTLARIGRYRWTICALLFFATTINYIDRQVLGILAPTLQRGHRVERGAVRRHRLVVHGRVRDRVSLRRPDHGSLRHAARVRRLDRRMERRPAMHGVRAHGWSASARPASRSALGESGNFPASIKTVAEWFPGARARVRDGHLQRRLERRRDRHADRRPVDRAELGWRAAFIATGALGFIWLVLRGSWSTSRR